MKKPRRRRGEVMAFPAPAEVPDRVHDEIVVELGCHRYRMVIDAKLSEDDAPATRTRPIEISKIDR